MKKSEDFSSVLADEFREYLEYVRVGGRVYEREEYILKAFDRFVTESNATEITEMMVDDFTHLKPDRTPAEYSLRHRVVREFAQYLFYMGKGNPIRPAQKSVSPQRRTPHIYTQEETAILLAEAKRLNPPHSLRPQTYYTLLGLLASTGLRINEAIALGTNDVDMKTGVLNIRGTKFYKSRLVPIHPTTLGELNAYRIHRERHFPKNTKAFFLNNLGLPLNYVTIYDTFLQIARNTGIRKPRGDGPRIHDFRHTFAVSRVLAWYEAGEDVNLMLVNLATYMGHEHFQHTIYYLEAGALILEKGSEGFALGGGTDA